MERIAVFKVMLPQSMTGEDLMGCIRMTISSKGDSTKWFFMTPATDGLWRIGRASSFSTANLAIYPSEKAPFFDMDAQYGSVLVKRADLPIYPRNPLVLDDRLTIIANGACRSFAQELADWTKGAIAL